MRKIVSYDEIKMIKSVMLALVVLVVIVSLLVMWSPGNWWDLAQGIYSMITIYFMSMLRGVLR